MPAAWDANVPNVRSGDGTSLSDDILQAPHSMYGGAAGRMQSLRQGLESAKADTDEPGGASRIRPKKGELANVGQALDYWPYGGDARPARDRTMSRVLINQSAATTEKSVQTIQNPSGASTMNINIVNSSSSRLG